jgi:putative ABC transport system ATP-binding protein
VKLELEDISKSYQQFESELKILEGLNLQVKAGEIVAVIGESGSGKSTLLSLLAGFSSPDRGLIRWDGEKASQWGEKQWAGFRKTHLGFVFQNYYLVPYLTALENAALPLRLNGIPKPESKASALLEELGLGARLTHLPVQLSGGECQRVAIARAMIHTPSLVLADEPTGSLDARTGAQVLEILFHLMKERRQSALIVTHSQEVAQRCDRIMTLRQGKLWS